jgi:hypothetical protein
VRHTLLATSLTRSQSCFGCDAAKRQHSPHESLAPEGLSASLGGWSGVVVSGGSVGMGVDASGGTGVGVTRPEAPVVLGYNFAVLRVTACPS